MIRIAVTQAAFEAIAATLPLGSVGYENEVNERGERYVWLSPTVVNGLRAMRGLGETYSEPILRPGPFRPCLRAPLDGNGGDVNLR